MLSRIFHENFSASLFYIMKLLNSVKQNLISEFQFYSHLLRLPIPKYKQNIKKANLARKICLFKIGKLFSSSKTVMTKHSAVYEAIVFLETHNMESLLILLVTLAFMSFWLILLSKRINSFV